MRARSQSVASHWPTIRPWLITMTMSSHSRCIAAGSSLVARIAAGVAVCIAGYFGINPPGFVAQVVAFAFGLAWVFTTLGLVLRTPSAVMNGGFMALFPLTFLSNVFVDPGTLPGWLEPANYGRANNPAISWAIFSGRNYGR